MYNQAKKEIDIKLNNLRLEKNKLLRVAKRRSSSNTATEQAKMQAWARYYFAEATYTQLYGLALYKEIKKLEWSQNSRLEN